MSAPEEFCLSRAIQMFALLYTTRAALAGRNISAKQLTTIYGRY